MEPGRTKQSKPVVSVHADCRMAPTHTLFDLFTSASLDRYTGTHTKYVSTYVPQYSSKYCMAGMTGVCPYVSKYTSGVVYNGEWHTRSKTAMELVSCFDVGDMEFDFGEGPSPNPLFLAYRRTPQLPVNAPLTGRARNIKARSSPRKRK
jgi:hypothetical protein